MPLHVSSTSAHRQEVKIVLYSLWYHHTYRWPSGAQSSLNLCTGRPPISVMIPEAVKYNFDAESQLYMTRKLLACCWHFSRTLFHTIEYTVTKPINLS